MVRIAVDCVAAGMASHKRWCDPAFMGCRLLRSCVSRDAGDLSRRGAWDHERWDSGSQEDATPDTETMANKQLYPVFCSRAACDIVRREGVSPGSPGAAPKLAGRNYFAPSSHRSVVHSPRPFLRRPPGARREALQTQCVVSLGGGRGSQENRVKTGPGHFVSLSPRAAAL